MPRSSRLRTIRTGPRLATSFSSTAIWEYRDFNLGGHPEPEQVSGMRVFASVFTMLGVRLQLVGHLASQRSREIGIRVAFMAVTLAAGAVLASWVPARRTASVDPVVVLRQE